jgi:hypothetical protein
MPTIIETTIHCDSERPMNFFEGGGDPWAVAAAWFTARLVDGGLRGGLDESMSALRARYGH